MVRYFPTLLETVEIEKTHDSIPKPNCNHISPLTIVNGLNWILEYLLGNQLPFGHIPPHQQPILTGRNNLILIGKHRQPPQLPIIMPVHYNIPLRRVTRGMDFDDLSTSGANQHGSIPMRQSDYPGLVGDLGG